jgi:hypothetical protein
MNKPLFLSIIALGSILAATVIGASVEEEFEPLYQEWETSFAQIVGFRSTFDGDAVYNNNPAFQKIVDLGVEAVPLIMEKMKTNPHVGEALFRITKWRYHINRTGTPGNSVWTVEEFPDERETKGPPDVIRVIERWWVEFRSQVPQRFAALYEEYNSLKDQGKKEEAEEKLLRIKDLGIDALPLLIDKIQQGDTRMIPAMAHLTDKKVPESASSSECVSWWAANKAKLTLPPTK